MERWSAQEPGDAQALYWLYTGYLNRILPAPPGVTPSQLLERAADGGDPRAQAALGYRVGRGEIPGGKSKGNDLFKPALAAGEPHAYLMLGGLYLEQTEAKAQVGQQDQEAFTSAIALLTKAGELGHCRAWSGLAKAHSLAGDWKQAHELAQKAAGFGDPHAYILLGNWYLHGRGVEKDPIAAVGWLEKAADIGQESAQRALGQLYLGRDGVQPDLARAFKWNKAAADAGDLDAKYDVARAFLAGDGTQVDLIEGRRMLLELADQGHHAAQFLAGKAYLDGLWLERDVGKARQMMKAAAEGGVEEAETYLIWLDKAHPQ
jgi:hypothetical protein